MFCDKKRIILCTRKKANLSCIGLPFEIPRGFATRDEQ